MVLSDDGNATVDDLSDDCNPRSGRVVMTDEDFPDALVRKS